MLAMGVPAGPCTMVYTILYLENKVPGIIFYMLIFLSLGWLGAGVDTLRTIIAMLFSVEVNDDFIAYRMHKIYWHDMAAVEILNTSHINAVT